MGYGMEEYMSSAPSERSNLEQLKNQAKDLLRAWKSSKELHRLSSHPKKPAEPKLADAQLVIAQENGYPSWAKLKRALELQAVESEAERFIEEACVASTGLHILRDTGDAEAVRRANPQITKENFACACVYGEIDAVRRVLAEGPERANAKIGAREWEPLLYVCFSFYGRGGSPREQDLAACAKALIDAGADPNVSFLSEPGNEASFEPAIYGAAGFLGSPALTRVLIAAGVDPNDYETPYHAPEHTDIAAVKEIWSRLSRDSRATVMLRFCDSHNYNGLEWCLERGGDPTAMSHWEDQTLHHSIRRLNPLRFQELILRHGGDVNGKTKSGQSAMQMAAIRGRTDVIDLLLAHGAVDDLTETQRFIYAVAMGDEAAAKRMLSQDPELVSKLSGEEALAMNSASGQGNLRGVKLMLELGFPMAQHGVNGDTPLHYAASLGQFDVVVTLVEAGAPILAKQMQDLTPKELAEDFLRNGWITKPEMHDIIRYLGEEEAKLESSV